MAIKHCIDALYKAHPFYGSRKLTVLLEPTFGPINRKRVQWYMRKNVSPVYAKDRQPKSVSEAMQMMICRS